MIRSHMRDYISSEEDQERDCTRERERDRDAYIRT